MNNGFERIIEIHPAFDRRHPDPKQNYGIHGVEMLFVLKGEKGATQFLLYTNWQLPHVANEMHNRTVAKALRGEDISVDLRCFFSPSAADRGYHSRTPMWDGQAGHDDCPWVNGGTCYYDGSGLNAEIVLKAMLEEGLEGIWKELEYYYHDVFDQAVGDRTVEGAEVGLMLSVFEGVSDSATADQPQPTNSPAEERQQKKEMT